MSIPKKFLAIKPSTIPNSGKGLFVLTDVPKNAVITEYIGLRTTWDKVSEDADNGYIYHIDDENVIDASKDKKSFGRYANDARGLTRIPGLKNNTVYHEDDNRVYLIAAKNILAGSEILVPYGAAYWKQIRDNIKIDLREKKQQSK
ncbi:MAG TPA: SET domain-containing protein [Niabella sp.]|nr:SET domain-containing protein [Niabella sp.]HOZ98381.1 SET domain-containing protein [Niabella sp.]HQW16340.1 SET domain-containing protein [Niabella sp.]HQX21593.1 SET domain-containing protein [Niabella sp.]HQX41989.1 SET domain-containing protein [Niabella sp.]